MANRLQVVLDRSLRAAEQFFGLESEGNIIDRCRRLEAASWDDIYRKDLPDLQTLSPLERGLADWIAEEASLRVLQCVWQRVLLQLREAMFWKSLLLRDLQKRL